MSLYPRVWLNPVVGAFRPWEREVLRAIADGAGADLAAKLRNQMQRLTLVQREDQGRTANLYRTDALGRLQTFAKAELIECAGAREVQLASLDVDIAGVKSPVVVHLVNGRIFSLSIRNAGAKHLMFGAAKVLGVRFDLRPEPDQVARHLPDDFDAIDREQAERPGLQLCDRSEVYGVVIQGVEYCFIGNVSDTAALLCRREAGLSAVYVCPYGGAPRHLASSLTGAIEKLTERRGDMLADQQRADWTREDKNLAANHVSFRGRFDTDFDATGQPPGRDVLDMILRGLAEGGMELHKRDQTDYSHEAVISLRDRRFHLTLAPVENAEWLFFFEPYGIIHWFFQWFMVKERGALARATHQVLSRDSRVSEIRWYKDAAAWNSRSPNAYSDSPEG